MSAPLSPHRGDPEPHLNGTENESQAGSENGEKTRKITSAQHVDWLEAIADGAGKAVSVLFFANQMRHTREELIAQFHEDAVDLYPTSRVFMHGQFMVGVKFHRSFASAGAVCGAVTHAWGEWNGQQCVGGPANALTTAVDGVMA